MRIYPQQKRRDGDTMLDGCCLQNLSTIWFLTLSKSPHIFKLAQEWMLADSNLITDLCAKCNSTHTNTHTQHTHTVCFSCVTAHTHTHTHTHTLCFSCVIAFHETHMHIHPHTIAACRNRLARRKSLPTYPVQTTPKSAPSDSDTMMMTLPWQHTPLVSCSSGMRALNTPDSIFRWWRPFGKQSRVTCFLLLCRVERETNR